MKGFTQEKDHTTANIVQNHLPTNQKSMSMKEFIQVKNHMNAKFVTKHLTKLVISRDMIGFMLERKPYELMYRNNQIVE